MCYTTNKHGVLVLWLYAGLLNLAPNSKEAQVFEQYAKQAAAQGTAPSGTGQFHHHQLALISRPFSSRLAPCMMIQMHERRQGYNSDSVKYRTWLKAKS
jgi:hypothetical protein